MSDAVTLADLEQAERDAAAASGQAKVICNACGVVPIPSGYSIAAPWKCPTCGKSGATLHMGYACGDKASESGDYSPTTQPHDACLPPPVLPAPDAVDPHAQRLKALAKAGAIVSVLLFAIVTAVLLLVHK